MWDERESYIIVDVTERDIASPFKVFLLILVVPSMLKVIIAHVTMCFGRFEEQRSKLSPRHVDICMF